MALKAKGVSAAAFHGSVKTADKDENLRRWLSGDILVMCATVAFGMGVDKADVRFGTCAFIAMHPFGRHMLAYGFAASTSSSVLLANWIVDVCAG
jgi:hypothetical protein